MGQVVINNVEYAWGDMSIVFGGRTFKGITSIKYKTTTDKEPIYGAGNEAHSIQIGRKSYEGALNLFQSEVEALDDAARNAGYDDLTDITADIYVSYSQKGSVRSVTETLHNVSFKEYEKGMSSGDKNMNISIPFTFMSKSRKGF